MAKQDFSALMSKVRENQSVAPMQTVTPVKKKKEETIFSFYTSTEKLRKLKVISAKKNISLKELISKAIYKEYF